MVENGGSRSSPLRDKEKQKCGKQKAEIQSEKLAKDICNFDRGLPSMAEPQPKPKVTPRRAASSLPHDSATYDSAASSVGPMKRLAESWVAESWGKQSFQKKERALKMHRTGNGKSEGSMLKVRCSVFDVRLFRCAFPVGYSFDL